MILAEIDNERYSVRVHSGKMTEEERKEVILSAAKEFYRDIQRCASGGNGAFLDGGGRKMV